VSSANRKRAEGPRRGETRARLIAAGAAGLRRTMRHVAAATGARLVDVPGPSHFLPGAVVDAVRDALAGGSSRPGRTRAEHAAAG
jgi:hypothetical protein